MPPDREYNGDVHLPQLRHVELGLQLRLNARKGGVGRNREHAHVRAQAALHLQHCERRATREHERETDDVKDCHCRPLQVRSANCIAALLAVAAVVTSPHLLLMREVGRRWHLHMCDRPSSSAVGVGTAGGAGTALGSTVPARRFRGLPAGGGGGGSSSTITSSLCRGRSASPAGTAARGNTFAVSSPAACSMNDDDNTPVNPVCACSRNKTAELRTAALHAVFNDRKNTHRKATRRFINTAGFRSCGSGQLRRSRYTLCVEQR